MISIYPLLLKASLHETLWGGQRLEKDGWKVFSPGQTLIGESWETEMNTIVQNGTYTGQTLADVVDSLGTALLGEQAIAIFGHRFPLLAKFIDANAQLSVQVHPKDDYAALHEGGKLGKTECWYILAAEPNSTIVYGFKAPTNRQQVEQAIQHVTLQDLLHEEPVHAGDVVFVPAGTVHAIGSGVLLYELQEYSDITYRMYDYGRLTPSGKPRELHIAHSLDVSDYFVPPQIKVKPVTLPTPYPTEDRCLVACRYFLTREIQLKECSALHATTAFSCLVLTCLGNNAQVIYNNQTAAVQMTRGETLVIPATLGNYQIKGQGTILLSYVPEPNDTIWQLWQAANPAYRM
jgi:mannose-6-phosphate isomerase